MSEQTITELLDSLEPGETHIICVDGIDYEVTDKKVVRVGALPDGTSPDPAYCEHPNDVQAADYSWHCPDCGRHTP